MKGMLAQHQSTGRRADREDSAISVVRLHMTARRRKGGRQDRLGNLRRKRGVCESARPDRIFLETESTDCQYGLLNCGTAKWKLKRGIPNKDLMHHKSCNPPCAAVSPGVYSHPKHAVAAYS